MTESTSLSSSSLPSLFCAIGSATTSLSQDDLRQQIDSFLTALGTRDDVLIIPPDFTRYHSQAGLLTQYICEYYQFITPTAMSSSTSTSPTTTETTTTTTTKDHETTVTSSSVTATTTTTTTTTSSTNIPSIQILPALGTHAPMTIQEIEIMFGQPLAQKYKEEQSATTTTTFLVHDWRNDVVTIGYVPASMVSKATNGMIQNQSWPAQLNYKVWEKRHSTTTTTTTTRKLPSLVLSIGQVVPHEVMGMANFNKNLFVGTGGTEAINLSHFIGAIYGMEQMMGQKNNPLRDILNYASTQFLESQLDVWYILTVVAPDPITGTLCVRGLYIGRDIECYSRACDLSLQVNFNMLHKPVQRMVTYLDPNEFHSTWLGNKAIYRTRMAMADHGQLIVLAPGVKRFGEDTRVDELIRKYGYKGTPATMQAMEEHQELKDNLSAVAHLIHGSTEGRFHVTYCPGHLSRQEIEQVGFQYADLEEMKQKYDIDNLKDGWNTDDDGEFFFIRNPALGLWAVKERFQAVPAE